MEIDGVVGFELLLVAGAGLKSRRRRRTREKDRIYDMFKPKKRDCLKCLRLLCLL